MSTSSASTQRDTLCQIQSLVSQINRYEDTSTSLALMKLIRSKFPKETQLEVNRLEHRSGKIWTLSELLDGLNEVIEEYEKLDDYTIDKPSLEVHAIPVSATRSRSSTPEPRYDSRTCCFCGSCNHRSTRCYHKLTPVNRRIIVRTLRLCWRCLRFGHSSQDCDRPNCRHCSGSHHRILCTRSSGGIHTAKQHHSRIRSRSESRTSSCSRARSSSYDTSSSRSSSRASSCSSRRSHSRSLSPCYRKSDGREHSKCHAVRFKPPARDSSRPYPDEELSIREAADSEDEYDQSSCHQHLNDPSATLVSTASDISTTSSLMTVEVLALDQQTNDHVAVILLLDTGAQRSFISQSAVDRLHVTVSHITPLTTVAFGAVRTTEQSARPTESPTILMVNGPIRMSSEANTRTLRLANVPYRVTALHLPHAVPSTPYYTPMKKWMSTRTPTDSPSHSRRVQASYQDTMKRSATSSSNPQSTKQPKPSGIPSAKYSMSASSSHSTSAPADRTVLPSAETPEDIQSVRAGHYSPLHSRRTDPIQSAPSRHSDRIRPPQELIAEYITDQSSTVENPSEDRSSISSKDHSQQIVQSLTNAAMLDHTFSMEHLATRDLVMVDAFVNHAFYITLREWLVEETPTPKEVRNDYPPVKDYSTCAIIQSYKELHAATEKMRQFTNDLAAHPEYWQSEQRLVQLHDEYLTLLHDLQTNRSTLTDLILPHILNSIEDNRLFVDTLDYYTITLAQIKLVCTAATTETAFGFLNLKKISSAIQRLRNSTSEQLLPAETLDLEDIPTIAEYNAVVSRTQSSTARTRLVEPQSRPEDVLVSVQSSSSATRPSTTDRRSVRTRHRSHSRHSRSPKADSRSRRRSPRSPSRSSIREQQSQEFVPPHITCHFCRANHYSSGCTAVRSLTARATKVVSQGRCPYCLSAHTPGYCRRKSECCVCGSIDHHPALCPYSYHVVRDIGPSVKAFFDKMYDHYKKYYDRSSKH
ncbi:hypothetical protein TELCIR_14195 [Teladorsagia circumcincta]|uniref:CCHC-type domain-containing protein n=1 Tax=Teladorsagia circumcincta TaxID=45464 RepID=A0A2G9U1S5_TELCI|nr:hypothetical protein TELCIR_14195 [Teladorsagia circumcincta]